MRRGRQRGSGIDWNIRIQTGGKIIDWGRRGSRGKMVRGREEEILGKMLRHLDTVEK